MRFHFIHAADLHIDSPLAALGAKDPRVAATFAAAGRKAVEKLIDATIDSGAKFLVVAGDVFDGDWRDVATGLFFVSELGRLDRAGVKTFLIRGNHDAVSEISRSLPYPPSVHVFDAQRGQTQLIEDLRVAAAWPQLPRARASPATSFRATRSAARAGSISACCTPASTARRTTTPYAPCTVADLARFGYDYWALGHIHAAEIVAPRSLDRLSRQYAGPPSARDRSQRRDAGDGRGRPHRRRRADRARRRALGARAGRYYRCRR